MNENERLRMQAEERFRHLLEFAPDAMVIINDKGRIEVVNNQTETLFGFSRDEMIGQPIEMLLPDRFCEKHVAQRDSYFAKPIIRKMGAGLDLYGLHRDGSEIPVDICLSPIEGNGDLQVVCAIRDISDRKAAEEERRRLEARILQAQKLESLGVLAGGIAHDFNNLLMGVLGNADLAVSELPGTSPALEYLSQIQKAAMRAADLCKQMLAYSGRGRFLVKAFSINELVEDMVQLLEVSIAKNVVLKYHYTENLPAIQADVNQIRQIVMNLVINASEAVGKKSGVVTISTGLMEANREYLSETYLDDDLPEGFYVFLEVSDTGCGMDAETKDKMFDPFFSTKFAGRGLGLAAVLGIIRGHRGAFKVYSQPAKGTTIKVLFPCTDQPEESLADETRAFQDWCGEGTMLVVDDEESVRSVAKRMLEQRGFTVLTANDGREAVEIYREHQEEIVAVLLDMTMPHLDGEAAFRELRRIQPNVPVILSSGYNEQDATLRFAGKGLAGFLQKPYRQGDLIGKLREILDG